MIIRFKRLYLVENIPSFSRSPLGRRGGTRGGGRTTSGARPTGRRTRPTVRSCARWSRTTRAGGCSTSWTWPSTTSSWATWTGTTTRPSRCAGNASDASRIEIEQIIHLNCLSNVPAQFSFGSQIIIKALFHVGQRIVTNEGRNPSTLKNQQLIL